MKYAPNDIVSMRISAGKGYRTVHALAENNNLLASGRTLVIDYDSNHTQIRITNLDGKSYSNTLQVDATYPIVTGLELTAAWRLNDVKCTYGGELMEKPLTSRYKGLLTASYKTPLGLWQFDATLQLNGGGRMPTPRASGDGTTTWDSRFHAYEQVSAQITRWFRHFSIYIGGENLTGFRQKQTIINAADPWSSTDALRLLREKPNYTIAVIAEEAGFSNVRTLQRRIQDAIGMSPVDYRLMLNRDV